MTVTVAVAPSDHGTVVRELPDELAFVQAPPGMEGLTRFTLSGLDDVGLLFALRSVEDPSVRLFAVAPAPYFPDYAPHLDATTRSEIGVGAANPSGPDSGLAADPATLLVIVHPAQGEDGPTANLLAPVAVNSLTGSAAQAVLEDDRWPLRAPFGAAAS